jgi:DNA (cytosine-5)-methyltransferase 1
MQFDTLAVNYTGEFGKPVIWIQSNENSALSNPKNKQCNSKLDRMRGSVFYSLGKPSPEYASYYSPFLWVTTLGVFVFDYLSGKEGDVMLECFRKDFSEWLERTFRERKFESQEKRLVAGQFYRQWLDEYGRTDFRAAVAGHKDWLWNQLHGLYHKPQDRMRNLTLWREIHTLDAIPNAYSGAHEELTVVTPYVYNIFKSMYGNHLKKIETPDHKPKSLAGVLIPKSPMARSRDGLYVPMLGDIVTFKQDEESRWTKHQKKSAGIDAWEGFWFGWVTKIRGNTLGIVWLYRPRDTILYKSEYPYKNEVSSSVPVDWR